MKQGKPNADTTAAGDRGPEASPEARGWRDANSIFAEAVELDEARRAAFLEEVCRDDAALAERVQRLLSADADAGDFLRTPAAEKLGFEEADAAASGDKPLLVAGDVLNARFRVVRLLGAGGMGQVYEAFDEDLRTPLALKVIRPEIAAGPGAVRRFRQEVRLARAITHANVCRTYDLERGSTVTGGPELVFLTMEYVAGETLHARLRRDGALTTEQALPIAHGIAAALDAAHACGVVHHDIKPHNILIAGDGRVVVTDFGLARRDPAFARPDGSTVMPSGLAGTLAYMSPEQIAGGVVTARTDIYSFGLLLAEMLNGEAVFPATSSVEGMARRFQDASQRTIRLPPGLPPRWRAAIAGCLKLSPEERFAGAGEVMRLLDGSGPRPKRAVAGWKIPDRRVWTGVAAAVVVVLALMLLLPRLKLQGGGGMPPGSKLYLPPARNQTGVARLDDLSTLLSTALSQSSQFNMVDPDKAAAILDRMNRRPDAAIDDATAREVAMRAGAARVVFASIVRKDGGLELEIELQATDSSPHRFRRHWSRAWTCCSGFDGKDGAIPPDLLRIVRDASDWVRRQGGEAADDIGTFNLPVEDVTTMDWDALREYARAQQLRAVGRPADAVIALHNAIGHDPGFALAYARLGDVLFMLDREQEGLEAYQKALQADGDRRLTRRERDFLRGIYAIDTWDYPTAEAVFRDATVYYDQDYLGWFYRGSVLMMLDRMAEADKVLQHAGMVNPGSLSAPLTRVPVLLAEGDRKAALAVADQLEHSGHKPEGAQVRAGEAYDRGDLQGTLAFLEQAQGSTNLHADSLMEGVSVAVEAGQYDRALELLSRKLTEDSASGATAEAGLDHVARAALECGAHEDAACAADVKEGMRLGHGPRLLLVASTALRRGLEHAAGPTAASLRQAVLSAQAAAAGSGRAGTDGNSGEVVRRQLRADLALAAGDTAGAAREYRREAVVDIPAAARFRLGLNLVAVARRERDASRRTALCREALDDFGELSRMRPRLWFMHSFFPPGVYAEALEAQRFAAAGAGSRAPAVAVP